MRRTRGRVTGEQTGMYGFTGLKVYGAFIGLLTLDVFTGLCQRSRRWSLWSDGGGGGGTVFIVVWLFSSDPSAIRNLSEERTGQEWKQTSPGLHTAPHLHRYWLTSPHGFSSWENLLDHLHIPTR